MFRRLALQRRVPVFSDFSPDVADLRHGVSRTARTQALKSRLEALEPVFRERITG
jgi:hypothetical protein